MPLITGPAIGSLFDGDLQYSMLINPLFRQWFDEQFENNIHYYYKQKYFFSRNKLGLNNNFHCLC